MRRASQLSKEEAKNLQDQFVAREERLAMSIDSMIPVSLRGGETRPPLPVAERKMEEMLRRQPQKGVVLPIFTRSANPKGPLVVFGYDYFTEHMKAAGIAEPKLLSYDGLWGSGEEYAYEVLNFADGNRNAQEIRDAVSAEYGPVPLELVVEYLRALEKIGVVEQVK